MWHRVEEPNNDHRLPSPLGPRELIKDDPGDRLVT